MEIIVSLLCICVVSWRWTEGVMIDRSDRDYQRIPDGKKNTADFCDKWGYPAEEHDVSTRDGYTLTLFRIPQGAQNFSRVGRVPVLLQHGVYLNSDQWVFRGTHDLPFLLADMGFDVWMGNTRGTRYSRHRRYSFNDFQFWNYSPDEISANDLPAMIDYILNETGKASLSYIGHSRGCAMAIMLLSTQANYNKKIHMLQFLAPVIYSSYAPCPIYYLAGNRPNSLMKTATLQSLVAASHVGRVMYMPGPVKKVLSSLCSSGTKLDMLCPFLFFFINGEDFANFNYSLTPLMLDHFTEGISTKEIIHLQQISETNRFQWYDYKVNGNLRRYGTDSPPAYNISRVQPPVYIYYGANDLFISEKDLRKFIRQLPNYISSYKVPYPKFNHIDYFWGKNTNQILFPTFLLDTLTFHKRLDSQSNRLVIT